MAHLGRRGRPRDHGHARRLRARGRPPPDNLKPWDLILRRLAAAADAGFVIAIYNPISRARDWQLAAAFEELRRRLAASTPVVFGRAVGRADEKVAITTLAAADPKAADKATLLIVGSSEKRLIARPG